MAEEHGGETMAVEKSHSIGMKQRRSQRRDAAARTASFCTEASDGSPMSRSQSELRARRGREVYEPMPASGRIALRASGLVVDHPCKACCGCWGIVLLLTLAGALTGELAFSGEGDKDWMVLDDIHSESLDALQLAKREVDCIPQNGSCPKLPIRSQSNKGILGLSIVYEAAAGESIFSPKNLQQACLVERIFTQNKYYPQFCHLKPGALDDAAASARSLNASDCEKQSASVVELFYQQEASTSECELLEPGTVANIAGSLEAALQDPAGRLQAGFYVGADAAGQKLLSRTRSVLGLGFPLEGYEQVGAGDLSLRTAAKVFWTQLEEDMLKHFGKRHTFTKTAYWQPWRSGEVEVLFSSLALQDLESERVVNSDMGWLLLSMLLVWGCLVWRTRSLFVGSLSLLQILFSIPVAFSVYRFIFQITYFQQLHGILIFIMLGIGADAVFVFSDAWQQSAELLSGISIREGGASGEEEGGDAAARALKARIALAYQRTMVSVFNTSLTTAVAFLATAISPIMPIKTMGIFACLLVLTNYVFVITLTPAAFAVWHTYQLNISRCLCWKRQQGVVAAETRPAENEEVVADSQPAGPPEQTVESQPPQAEVLPKKSLLELSFLPIFGRPSVAAASALVFAVWGGINCYWAAQLEPPPEMFQFFGEEHMHTRLQDLSGNGFIAGSSDDYMVLQISFGISGVDRKPSGGASVDPWAPHKFFGVQVWDESFDLSQPEAQDYLRGFCRRLRAAPCDSEGCSGGLLVQPNPLAVSCFIEEFDAWAGNATYQGPAFVSKLQEFRRTQQPRGDTPNSWEKVLGFVDGKLHFVEVQAMLTFKQKQPGTVKEEVLATVMSFISEEQTAAPASAGHLLQTGGAEWIMLVLEQELVKGLFSGFAICFPTAFLVLLFATQNLVVATYAILTIGAIVMSVLGWCWAVEGWYLGVSESIAGIIVIGLAVDYVIHLGHMYLEVGHLGYDTREERWRMALKNMGVTVLAGAFTTLAAGLSMRFCQMTFFLQMSTLVSVTIVYSLLFTLLFFMCLLRLAGPEHSCGDISGYLRQASSFFKLRSKENAEPCDDVVQTIPRHASMA